MNTKFLDKIVGQVWPRKLNRRELIKKESELGKQLFGPIPAGHDRDFFCLDDHTWVWHEGWRDAKGSYRSVSTRYEIHQDRIIKIQDGQPNRLVGSSEAERLLEATKWYYHLVGKHVYGLST